MLHGGVCHRTSTPHIRRVIYLGPWELIVICMCTHNLGVNGLQSSILVFCCFRPVAGHVNICPYSIGDAMHLRAGALTSVKHEILHTLVGL